MTSWVLKRRRYDGSETVITRYSIHSDAQNDADMLNAGYQSAQYYVEPFDSVKRASFTNDTLVNSMVARIKGQPQEGT